MLADLPRPLRAPDRGGGQRLDRRHRPGGPRGGRRGGRRRPPGVRQRLPRRPRSSPPHRPAGRRGVHRRRLLGPSGGAAGAGRPHPRRRGRPGDRLARAGAAGARRPPPPGAGRQPRGLPADPDLLRPPLHRPRPLPGHPLGRAGAARHGRPGFRLDGRDAGQGGPPGLRCAEVPVSYRRRVGVSKITGTITGTVRAGYKILWTVARHIRG